MGVLVLRKRQVIRRMPLRGHPENKTNEENKIMGKYVCMDCGSDDIYHHWSLDYITEANGKSIDDYLEQDGWMDGDFADGFLVCECGSYDVEWKDEPMTMMEMIYKEEG